MVLFRLPKQIKLVFCGNLNITKMKYEAHLIKVDQPDEPISTISLQATEEGPVKEEFRKTYGLDNEKSLNKEVRWKLMCMAEGKESVDYEIIF